MLNACSSVQFSRSFVSDSLQAHESQQPGLPVHHQLTEFTQTHVHRVGDAIPPSHPLSSPSPLAPNPSQNQGLFQWVNSLYEVAKVLEFQSQHQSFQWAPRTDLLQNGPAGPPCSPRASQGSSPAPHVACVCSVAQSCPTLCDPMDCSPPGSSVHGILQARIWEWVAISFSRASSQPRDQTRVSCVSCIGRWVPYHCISWEAPTYSYS